MNKQQIETIIDKLAGRCHCYDSCSPKFKHPILIGDVLEKLTNTKPLFDMILAEEILDLWRHLGFDKSVQQIIEASGWEAVEAIKIKNGLWELQRNGERLSQHSMREGAERMARNLEQNNQQVLKSPEASKLIEFLITISQPT